MEILINEETYLNNIGFLSNKHMNNLCDNSRFIQESKLSQIVDSEPLLVEDMFIIDYGKYIAKKIKSKQSDRIILGNLSAKRDWGFSGDYVEAMWLMLQQDKPEDFVIATGRTSTVREFCILTFRELGVELEFRGKGTEEIGFVKSTSRSELQFKVGQEVIKIDTEYYRPTEVELLIGDPSKANRILGWKPRYNLEMLVKEMVSTDLGNIV